jgi:FAD/FMN-containing dehydrogenase
VHRFPDYGLPHLALRRSKSRAAEHETAFNGHSAGHGFNIRAMTQAAEGRAEEKEWARGLWSALEPYHTSVYVNFLMEEGEKRVRQAYGAEKYERLKGLKRRYDPDNFFRRNQNVPPG